MDQRRPRLGDVLDDYCPRERRITNHVIVAMLEDAVKQTRCSTCDSDHEYKQARTPSPRRTKAAGAIQDGEGGLVAKPVLTPPRVPDDLDEPSVDAEAPAQTNPEYAKPAMAAAAPPHAAITAANAANSVNSPSAVMSAGAGDPVIAAAPAEDAVPDESDRDEGPVHRRLIRATLPRPEGHVPERKEPEFTIRQQGGRGGGGREVDGNSVGYRQRGPQAGGVGGPSRFGGQRNGSGPGQRPGGRPPGPNGGQRGGRPDGRPDGQGNSRGPRPPGPGSNRRRGGR